MKLFAVTLAALGLAASAIATAPTAEAHKRSYHHKHKYKSGSWHRARNRHRFSRRDYNRLPIRVTRPPNTGHYIHQDFPLWAARAFQPSNKR